jgi:hypothetical protein
MSTGRSTSSLPRSPAGRPPTRRDAGGRRWPAALRWCAVLLAAAGLADAASAITVTMNTTSLASTSGRFEFLLLDGDAAVNNSVTISSVVSNGSFVGTDCAIGCTGGPPFVLDDSLGLGQFLYDLTLGTSFSFDLDYTTNFAGVLGTDPPDRFALSLLDPGTNFTLVRTDILFPPDALLIIDLIGGGIVQAASTTDPSVTVNAPVAAIPEPSAVALMALGLAALGRRRALDALRGLARR